MARWWPGGGQEVGRWWPGGGTSAEDPPTQETWPDILMSASHLEHDITIYVSHILTQAIDLSGFVQSILSTTCHTMFLTF